ncbi:hypothetical protein GGQ83_001519 [Roseococcus suduntuyensis]|uniref:Uncharacterized protein n=1 Tax=Roseococcus suduntuyensis TaxID=455361 RepID=A0A840AB09_9PROT|nr:hypothetical protein [Roseococcus suduntuyensis]
MCYAVEVLIQAGERMERDFRNVHDWMWPNMKLPQRLCLTGSSVAGGWTR